LTETWWLLAYALNAALKNGRSKLEPAPVKDTMDACLWVAACVGLTVPAINTAPKTAAAVAVVIPRKA
jgi:hypothetical protein